MLQLNDEELRLRLLMAGVVLAFLFLGSVIWKIQVVRQSEFQTSESRQNMRRVRLPAPRGRILDRQGTPLAVNRPSYGIAIYVEELRQPGRASRTADRVEEMIDRLSAIMRVRRQIDRDEVLMHIQRRRPLPLLAWRDLDERALARWAEWPDPLPGVDIYVEPLRSYPAGSLAAHIVGQVGRLDDETLKSFDYTIPEMEGRSGIELALNDTLAGEAGGRLLQVDASGFKHRETFVKDPVPGMDVRLTLDARIQGLVESELEGERGACVVMDPRNGDVLAMASSPSFDPDAIRDFTAYRALTADPSRPLFNRALTGIYPPGSTFKPVVAIAALENRRAQPDTVLDCPGYFEVGGVRIRCWRRSGHGSIAMQEAIEQSCNAYFCALGLQCGYERIYHMAEAIGFGYPTGIGLSGEASGLLPNNAWKKRVYNDAWRSGDTCNVSIGQGPILVTPLQMAMFASVLANGGHVFRPRLAMDPERTEGELINEMGWSRETMRVVRGGMTDVVEAPSGTGKRAKLEGVTMAGKTGSAEYGPRENRKKYAWMILFAPVESPRYALAMVIEDGVSGGTTTAPRLRNVMEGLFNLEKGLAWHAKGGVES